MLGTIIGFIARVAITTGICIAYSKWYMDKINKNK